MRLTAVIAAHRDLHAPELQSWIARGWVHAEPVGAEPADYDVQDIDVARIRLIHDLRHALAVEEDTVPLVLGLLDQVYGLRRSLRAVARVLADQPDAVRAALRDVLGERP